MLQYLRVAVVAFLALGFAARAHAYQPHSRPVRPVERERRVEAERNRETERREHQRADAESAKRLDREALDPVVLRVEWDKQLRDLVAAAPERSRMKGWSEQILKFERDFRDRTPSSAEIRRWMDVEISGKDQALNQNKFRGALREVSDLCLLRQEGYTQIKWNPQREPVRYTLPNGEVRDLGTREIDIIATRPLSEHATVAKTAPRDGRTVYIETKNADLSTRPSKAEFELLSARIPVERLVERCSDKSKPPSREFLEMVKDICLVRADGRLTLWKVNAARPGLRDALAHYGIELEVYH